MTSIVAQHTSAKPAIPFIRDCNGSKDGSLAPIAAIAQKDANGAVLLPFIVVDATDTVASEYSFDVAGSAALQRASIRQGCGRTSIQI